MLNLTPQDKDGLQHLDILNFKIIDRSGLNNNNADGILRYPFEVVSEYDQEIPQSQTADKPVAP